ncbi:MAG: ROK family protein [Anaerolineales bacterium]|nr:ROK family protein [Anaerolineales bacterium]
MGILGIDIGGTGIKGAPVDTESGLLLEPRHRLVTPDPSTPQAVGKVVAELTQYFEWSGPIGCGFPAAMHQGKALTAANIAPEWIGTDAAGLFSHLTNCPVKVINDADAAGLAEINFGAGKNVPGLVMIITIGTGLGTALFVDGKLVPNTELGHIEINGKDAEWSASEAARLRYDLSWKKWARNLDQYLKTLERLFWPDLFILGGGAIKKKDKFLPLLTVETKIVPALLGNEAGIVGAALAAM